LSQSEEAQELLESREILEHSGHLLLCINTATANSASAAETTTDGGIKAIIVNIGALGFAWARLPTDIECGHKLTGR